MAKLGELGKIITGNTPKTSDARNYESNDICFVKPSDFTDNKITEIHQSEFYISGYAKNKARVLPADSILVTCIGIIGKVAINKISCAFNQQINAIVPDKKICDSKYVAYAIQNAQPKIQIIANAAVVPILNKTQFSNIEVQLPQLEEQRQIANRLGRVDKLIFLRKQQLTKLDELVKARFVEMFENNTYPKVKVSTVCDFITKGTTPPNDLISEEYSSDKVPYLKVYNLSFNGELLFDTAPQYISENIHNGMLARSKVYPNDVLMNIVGPPLGKFSLVTDEFPEWNINQAIAIFRAKEKINPKYLLSALMQPEVLNPFLRQAVGIRQLNLSLSQCRDLEIFLPPLSLQNQFAAFVAEVDKSKQTVQQSLDKLELLKKALMQEYFG